MGMQLPICLAAAFTTLAFAAEPQAPAPPREGVQPGTERVSPRPRIEPVMSARCYTIAANCILGEAQPRDSKCWCATPFGPSYGTVK